MHSSAGALSINHICVLKVKETKLCKQKAVLTLAQFQEYNSSCHFVATMSAMGKESTPSAATASGSLTLPSKNHELKRQEDEALFGQDLLLMMRFPDGSVIDMKVRGKQ